RCPHYAGGLARAAVHHRARSPLPATPGVARGSHDLLREQRRPDLRGVELQHRAEPAVPGRGAGSAARRCSRRRSQHRGNLVSRVTSAAPAPSTVSHRGALPAAKLGVTLLLCVVALAVVSLLSLRVGSIGISNTDAWDPLVHFNLESYEQTVVRTLRLPRTIIGLGVGAALAMAGAAMQATTRNPLAGPDLLGVNSGAAFGIVTAVYYGHLTHPLQFVWFAFAGGLAAAAATYAIGSAGTGGATPVKLALAGVVVSSLLSSWLTALLLLDQQTLEVVRFWLAGSLAGRDLATFTSVLP